MPFDADATVFHRRTTRFLATLALGFGLLAPVHAQPLPPPPVQSEAARVEALEARARARAVAADPANEDQLDRLSMADGTQDRIAEVITNLRGSSEGQVMDWKRTPAYQNLPPRQRARVDDAIGRFKGRVAARLSPALFMDSYRDYYRQNFTATELDQLAAFYETPLGEKERGAREAVLAETFRRLDQEVRPMVAEESRLLMRELLGVALDSGLGSLLDLPDILLGPGAVRDAPPPAARRAPGR